MAFLELLARIRTPWLDKFMLAITYFGSEIAFLVVALVIFWCADKRKGYYILSVGFVGTILNQFMKLWFRVPRPWLLKQGFTPVEGAVSDAGGYSFPSGHTQNSVGTFGGIAYTVKDKFFRYGAVVLAVLVPFSRMYLGVHTPADVLVGAVAAVAVILVLHPLVLKGNGKYFPCVIGGMLVLGIAYLLFTEFYPFPADVQAENLYEGKKNAYTLLGCILGLLPAYYADKKWIHFSVDARWWVQIVKVALGLALVLAIKAGLSSSLASLLGEFPGRCVRYFLMVVFAGILWPMTFPFWNSLGRKGP